MILFLLNYFLLLAVYCLVALLLCGTYARLKDFSFKRFLRLSALNLSTLFLGKIIDIIAKRSSECPRLLGECYTEAYRDWSDIVLLFWTYFFIFNLVLTMMILHLLMRRLFSFVYNLARD